MGSGGPKPPYLSATPLHFSLYTRSKSCKCFKIGISLKAIICISHTLAWNTLVHPFPHPSISSSIHFLVHPFPRPTNPSPIHRLVHPFPRPSIPSSIHLLVHPFPC